MAPIPVEAGLCPSEEAFNRAYVVWQKQRRVKALTPPHPENPLPDGLSKILGALNPSISPMDMRAVVDRMVEAFVAECLPGLCPTPGVRQMLDAWQGMAKMGVVSDYFLRDCPQRLLAELDLDGYFEFILDSASVGFRKPAGEIYQEALRRATLNRDQAGEVLFVGDNLELDVIAPAGVGMRSMHYDSNRKVQEIKDASHSYPSIAHWDEFRPHLFAERGGAR
jgi:FMN phosphatase YigB (HAD superfamily)